MEHTWILRMDINQNGKVLWTKLICMCFSTNTFWRFLFSPPLPINNQLLSYLNFKLHTIKYVQKFLRFVSATPGWPYFKSLSKHKHKLISHKPLGTTSERGAYRFLQEKWLDTGNFPYLVTSHIIYVIGSC